MTNEMMQYRPFVGLITKMMKNGTAKDYFIDHVNVYYIRFTYQYKMLTSAHHSKLIK